MIKLSDQLHKCGYREGFDPAGEMRGSIAHDLLANAIALSAIWPYFPTPHRKIIHHAPSRIRFAVAWLRTGEAGSRGHRIAGYGRGARLSARVSGTKAAIFLPNGSDFPREHESGGDLLQHLSLIQAMG
jgi:hypothetical protein